MKFGVYVFFSSSFFQSVSFHFILNWQQMICVEALNERTDESIKRKAKIDWKKDGRSVGQRGIMERIGKERNEWIQSCANTKFSITKLHLKSKMWESSIWNVLHFKIVTGPNKADYENYKMAHSQCCRWCPAVTMLPIDHHIKLNFRWLKNRTWFPNNFDLCISGPYRIGSAFWMCTFWYAIESIGTSTEYSKCR